MISIALTGGFLAGRFYEKGSLSQSQIEEVRTFLDAFVKGSPLERGDVEVVQEIARQTGRKVLIRKFIEKMTLVLAMIEIPDAWFENSRTSKKGSVKAKTLLSRNERREVARPIYKILKQMEDGNNVVQRWL